MSDRPVHFAEKLFVCFLVHTVQYSIIQFNMAPKKVHSGNEGDKNIQSEKVGNQNVQHSNEGDKNVQSGSEDNSKIQSRNGKKRVLN